MSELVPISFSLYPSLFNFYRGQTQIERDKRRYGESKPGVVGGGGGGGGRRGVREGSVTYLFLSLPLPD